MTRHLLTATQSVRCYPAPEPGNSMWLTPLGKSQDEYHYVCFRYTNGHVLSLQKNGQAIWRPARGPKEEGQYKFQVNDKVIQLVRVDFRSVTITLPGRDFPQCI